MIGLREIQDARKTIQHLIKRTPSVHSQFLSNLCGGEVFLKLENLQANNSFKIRGAINRMFNLSAEEKRHGVITASTGNHAVAVAVSAEKLNLAAKIVVPVTTPKVKIEKIKKHRVELILHGEIYDQAEQYARDLAKEETLIYVSAYNDDLILAGQGTIGLEILEDVPSVDTIIVPVSGGGLLGGIAIAAKGVKPSVEVLGVQPETTPAMYESLKAGKIVNVEMKDTIADALSGNIESGAMTFEIAQTYVKDVLVVKEETIKKAIRLLWEKEKQIAEGAGAIAIAPIIDNKERFARKTTVAVISGGNIDDELFQSILASGPFAGPN